MQPLNAQPFTEYSRPVNAADRVRRRIKELLDERGWSQRALADALGKTQPWMSQLLGGSLRLGLDELDQVALALGATAVELVRDPEQFQFCADLTPSEMAMLRKYRKLGPSVREAIATLVNAADPAGAGKPNTGQPRFVGAPPATPAELHTLVAAFANQVQSYINDGQAESGRQASATRANLAVARADRRSRRRRVPEKSAGK